jgi:hypothetical protein
MKLQEIQIEFLELPLFQNPVLSRALSGKTSSDERFLSTLAYKLRVSPLHKLSAFREPLRDAFALFQKEQKKLFAYSMSELSLLEMVALAKQINDAAFPGNALVVDKNIHFIWGKNDFPLSSLLYYTLVPVNLRLGVCPIGLIALQIFSDPRIKYYCMIGYRYISLESKYKNIWYLPLVWMDLSLISYPESEDPTIVQSYDPEHFLGRLKKEKNKSVYELSNSLFAEECRNLREMADTYTGNFGTGVAIVTEL